MAKLRHIAVHTPDPEKTAEFYKRVFDMAEVGRTDSPIAKGIYLSDGTINLAVLRFKTTEAADRQDGLGLGPVIAIRHCVGRRLESMSAGLLGPRSRGRCEREGEAESEEVQAGRSLHRNMLCDVHPP